MAAALGSLGKKVSGVFAKAGSRARMAPGEGSSSSSSYDGTRAPAGQGASSDQKAAAVSGVERP